MSEGFTARLSAVRARIAAACARAARDPAQVRLVAVSKRHPPELIRRAFEAGQRDFGENYVQELADKAAALADLVGLRWHFIGHLQRNKVKRVVSVRATVQTVDSLRLAMEVSKRALAEGVVTPVFVQVNVGAEARKSGCATDEASALVAGLRALEGLELTGLMTMPPASSQAEGARPHFRRLARLAAALDLGELSMGMSHDLEVAVEEGATVVRVGTALFGPRPV